MSEEAPPPSTTATETPDPVVSEEASKQEPETVAATETPISTAVVAEAQSEVNPISSIPPEDVPAVLCCACCAACTLFVVCLPCEIIGFVVRCLCLPFKCAILCCCPKEEKAPVPGSETPAA